MKNSGRFPKGHIPWNKGMRGIVHPGSVATQFKPGIKPVTKLLIGSETIRYTTKTDSSRAWVKTKDDGNPSDWTPRSRIVYQQHHGKIPTDFVIHNIDGDPLNDHPDNLVAMSRGDHLMHHLPEYEEKLRKAQSRSAKKRWQRYRKNQLEKQLAEYDSYYWEDER